MAGWLSKCLGFLVGKLSHLNDGETEAVKRRTAAARRAFALVAAANISTALGPSSPCLASSPEAPDTPHLRQ